jgi:hypothetical protein
MIDRNCAQVRAMRQHMHVSGYGRDYAVCQIETRVTAESQL